MVFFYIKTPLRVKEAGLEELILTTWWPTHFDKEVRGGARGGVGGGGGACFPHCLSLFLSVPPPPLSQGKDEREPADESADERLRRRAYERGCQRLKKRIEGEAGVKGHRGHHQEQGSRVLDPTEGPQQFFSPPALLVSSSVVEELQVQILKLLLNNKDKSTVGDRREGTPWRGVAC